MLCSWSLVLEIRGEMSRHNLRFRRLIDGGCGVDLLSRLHFTLLAVQTITNIECFRGREIRTLDVDDMDTHGMLVQAIKPLIVIQLQVVACSIEKRFTLPLSQLLLRAADTVPYGVQLDKSCLQYAYDELAYDMVSKARSICQFIHVCGVHSRIRYPGTTPTRTL
jgi:hypothetical protein